jgi:hypothetical protein
MKFMCERERFDYHLTKEYGSEAVPADACKNIRISTARRVGPTAAGVEPAILRERRT